MNRVTPWAAEAFGSASLNWLTGDFRLVLIDGSHTDSLTHQWLSHIPPAARIATHVLTGKGFINGGFRSDAPNFGPLDAQVTRTIRSWWIYHHAATEETSLLVAFFNTGRWGPIEHTINGMTPVVIDPSPRGWWVFTNT